VLDLWKKFPVVIRSVITGFLVAAAGTLPWAAMFAANVKFLPAIPWSFVTGAIYLWFWWKYFGGEGPPASTSETRQRLLRANPISSDLWSAAIATGMLATVTFVVFLGVFNRMVRTPPQTLESAAHTPGLTLFLGIILGSLVAGVVEEGSFRGYMQSPIEHRHGPVVAMLTTGLAFTFAHATHSYFAIALLPYYLAIATMYGALAYLTNSILPGLVLHTILDIFSGLQVMATGRAEWLNNSKPLVWESGPDATFWLSVIATLAFGVASVRAYTALGKLARGERQHAARSSHGDLQSFRSG
jgi:membrane protease YdiL (CAAX protease family)